VPILDRLSKAQGGQAFANLARAFHLPPTKVEPAVGAMVGALIAQIDAKTRSRRFLARLVELLGERAHHQVLENPTMLGTTSTQVLGNQALNVVAGREASKQITRQAAAQAGASEMIAEYLLPVIAAMLVGALADASREGLESLMRRDGDETDPGRFGQDRGEGIARVGLRVDGEDIGAGDGEEARPPGQGRHPHRARAVGRGKHDLGQTRQELDADGGHIAADARGQPIGEVRLADALLHPSLSGMPRAPHQNNPQDGAAAWGAGALSAPVAEKISRRVSSGSAKKIPPDAAPSAWGTTPS